MGIPSEMRDGWASRRKRNAFFIASPAEEQRIRNARNCEQEGILAGTKAASIAWVATAVPMLAAVRLVPSAKANLNKYTLALILSSAYLVAYSISFEKTILECERRNTQYEKSA